MTNGKSKLKKYVNSIGPRDGHGKGNLRNISALSDREMDNDKSKLKKYFSSIGPGDE